jgi:hypothetical protein
MRLALGSRPGMPGVPRRFIDNVEPRRGESLGEFVADRIGDAHASKVTGGQDRVKRWQGGGAVKILVILCLALIGLLCGGYEGTMIGGRIGDRIADQRCRAQTDAEERQWCGVGPELGGAFGGAIVGAIVGMVAAVVGVIGLGYLGARINPPPAAPAPNPLPPEIGRDPQ